MKIALDIMGGDAAPLATLQGAVLAAEELPVTVAAVGEPDCITRIAKENGLDISKLEIVPAASVITMEDEALSVVRAKKDSSMSVGLRYLAAGEADAFVSAGNTGALLAGATLLVRRIKGIERPGIATLLPFACPVLLLDSGANLEITPHNAVIFGMMGGVYMQNMYGLDAARIGLLNNGTEEHKGLPFQQEAYKALLDAPLSFVGNVEPKSLPFDVCDVLVTDGFSGNILLKTVEGTSKFVLKAIKEMFYRDAVGKLSGLMMKSRMASLKKQFDTSEHGGAPILGMAKPVIKAHGSSDARAIKNAVRQAMQYVKAEINPKIEEQLPRFAKKKEEPNT